LGDGRGNHRLNRGGAEGAAVPMKPCFYLTLCFHQAALQHGGVAFCAHFNDVSAFHIVHAFLTFRIHFYCRLSEAGAAPKTLSYSSVVIVDAFDGFAFMTFPRGRRRDQT